MAIAILFIWGSSFPQTRIYSRPGNQIGTIFFSDSAHILPKQAGLFMPPNLGRDSTGGVWYRTTDNKFYGKFNTGSKPFASEDSVLRRWDSTTVKNYVANTSTTPTALPVSTIYADGTSLTSFPTAPIIYVTPTTNGTIELSSSAVYPGYANKVAVIINTSNFTYNIHGVAVSSKIVWVMWNASGSFSGFTPL